MAERPAKRARRTDSSAMWDENPRSGRTDRDSGPSESRKTERPERAQRRSRSRSRSRDRDRREPRRRDRDERDNRGKTDDRDARNGRDDGGRGKGRGDGDREKGRDGPRTRKQDSRGRSRSPTKDTSTSTSVRQRSPPRGPRSAPTRERDRDRERGTGDKTPKPNGTTVQPSVKPTAAPKGKENGDQAVKDVEMENGEEEDEDEAAMRKLMGFAGFKSTKNTKVPGNDKNFGVRKEKKTEYRQYMNRTGGFNRPLSPS